MKITRRRLKEIIAEESNAIEESRALSIGQLRDPVVRVGSMLHAGVPYGKIASLLGIRRMDLINTFKDQAESMVRAQIAGMLIELAEQIKEEDKTS
jgi:hypothetical protein